MKELVRVLFLSSIVTSLTGPAALAQLEAPSGSFRRSQAPKVFLDCNRCDFSFVRQEITFVNYVRDPELAQVHVFVTDQQTGSGGRAYTMTFTGQQNFAGLDNTLAYTSRQTDTYDEERRGVVEMIKIGLVPYVARTPLAAQVSVSFEEPSQVEPEPVDDPWNSWVFDIEASGSFDTEATRNSYSVDGSISAGRVTELWKIQTRIYGYYDERNFEREDETITSISHRGGFQGAVVKSLTDHWSVGVFQNIYSNSFRNTDLSIGMTPAVEYNIYPYEESSRKELTLSYRVGYAYKAYMEQTIFQRTRESLVSQSLHANVRIRQPWGFIFAGLSGSHYFHDLTKNSIDFYSNVSLRLLRGLSLRVRGGFEIIHDQLYLAAGGATLEEILLQRKQLETTYEISGSIGLAYTCGSIYNNVVNTRL